MSAKRLVDWIPTAKRGDCHAYVGNRNAEIRNNKPWAWELRCYLSGEFSTMISQRVTSHTSLDAAKRAGSKWLREIR